MIAIINYGLGNLFSLQSSFKAIGEEVTVTGDADEIRSCDRLVLPGVGAFRDATALLAKTGLLDGKYATSNKMALSWAKSCSKRVLWLERARWAVDGKFYTASGVSAGMDMALGFMSDRFGEEKARTIARNTEYVWNSDPQEDPFAKTEE